MYVFIHEEDDPSGPKRLIPADTDPRSWNAQRRAQAELGPEGRVRASIAMSEALREIRLAGLSAEFPEETEGEIMHRFIREAHGMLLPLPPQDTE